MDLTTLFKAYVKTVRTTNKNLGINNKMTPILKTSSNRDIYLTKAKQIVKQLTNLQNFLIENKSAYLNLMNYLSINKSMSEADREKVDLMAESIVTSCRNHIIEYQKEIESVHFSGQKEEHYKSISDSLEQHLKNVWRIYLEMKTVRVKRVIDTHKLSKLGTTLINEHKSESEMDWEVAKNEPGVAETKGAFSTISTPLSVPSKYENELSPEDMQMFESENEHLYQELNSISDEVQQMESKVAHLAELQNAFTEKVLQQETDINRISDNVVHSNENIKDANEQIKEALQRNAGFRAWILFILLVLSFSLLFLDWYNP